MLDIALAQVALGYSVFPCEAGGKRPLGVLAPRGLRDATRDEQIIRSWWQQAPTANVGIVPGSRGEVVLDLDLVLDPDTLDTICDPAQSHKRLLGAGLVPGPTRTVRTPSGGLHVYLTLPPGVEVGNARALGNGIDIRGHGGYVIAPGCTRGATGWKLEVDAPVAPAPAPLLEVLAAPREEAKLDTKSVTLDSSQSIARFTERLARAAGEGQGNRDNACFEHVCEGRDLGLSAGLCLALTAGWAATCNPPFPPDEVRRKVVSAYGGNAQNTNPGAKTAQAIFADFIPKPKLASFRELTDPAPDEEPTPLIEGLLYPGDLALMVGESQRFKSFLALDLALHLALGKSWAGFPIVGAKKVLYVAAEGARGIRRRARAWLDHHKEAPAGFQLHQGAIPLTDGCAALLELLRAERPAVAFVDTLSASLPGADENSSRDMSPVLTGLRACCDELGCALVVLHHTRRKAEAGTGGRGWSGMPAGADCIMEVTAEGVRAMVEFAKVRDERRPKNCIFNGVEKPAGTGKTAAGGTRDVTSLVFLHDAKGATARKESAREKVERARDMILRGALTETEMNSKQLAAAMAAGGAGKAKAIEVFLVSAKRRAVGKELFNGTGWVLPAA